MAIERVKLFIAGGADMQAALSLDTQIAVTSLKITVAALIVSIVALLVAIIATAIGKNSLTQAQKDSQRNLQNWRQTKWFDLYFEADKAYDMLDAFQVNNSRRSTHYWDDNNQIKVDWNELMFQIRRVHSMAAVFPKTML